MKTKTIDKKLQKEIKFLMAIIIIFCLILSFIIAYLELNYKISIIYEILIIVPIATILGIFCLYHMYKKDVLNPKLKKDLKKLFGRNK